MNYGQKYDIFISYRRSTGANVARMMQLALTARGYSVFLDYDSLEDGKFNEAIYSAIDSCEVFILMMTEGALDRCAKEDDWVRLEILRAIEGGKHIVPIRPSDQAYYFPPNLPEELSVISKEQVSKLDMESLFNESVVKIEIARFPKALRDFRHPSVEGADAASAEMFRMFARAKREREMIAKLPDEYRVAFAEEIRVFEDDLAAAEDARMSLSNAVASSLVAQVLKEVDALKAKIEALKAKTEDERKPGDEMLIALPDGEKMVFCWCPATTSKAWKMVSGGQDYFLMGSPESEEDHEYNEKQHRVTLTRGFWMGKYAVTQWQWELVMGKNPSDAKGSTLPVENVSWDDCQEFIRKINAAGKVRVSLPTEAQWEYACRAGATTPFSFGSTLEISKANFFNHTHESRNKTVPVGSYVPNDWGLFNMHGNVFEWCADWYGDYEGDVTDPTGPATGSLCVMRGGSFFGGARCCRSAFRYPRGPARASLDWGFRLACIVE